MAAVKLLDAVAELHLAEGLEVGDDPVALRWYARRATRPTSSAMDSLGVSGFTRSMQS
jgi:hypothetical protein